MRIVVGICISSEIKQKIVVIYKVCEVSFSSIHHLEVAVHTIRSCFTVNLVGCMYRSADKSLARPGRKQATATEDFEFHVSYL